MAFLLATYSTRTFAKVPPRTNLVGFFSDEVAFGSKELHDPGTGPDIFMAKLSASGGL